MKKTLLAIGAVLTSVVSIAQVDTLTTHMVTTGVPYVIDNVAPIDSGFVAGNNFYGDLAKMQLFDGTYGVAGGGTITGVLLSVPVKIDGGGSIDVSIWGDNSGQPNYASALGTVTVPLANIDTTIANYSLVSGTNAFYNLAVTFPSAVTIPAGNKFWAGVVLPTGQNLISLECTNASVTPFTAASTHTGEIQSSGTFFSFNDGTTSTWQLNSALSIFPVVNFTAGLNENVIDAVVYPNPANNVLNIQAKEDLTSITVTTMDGKVVATSTTSSVNVAELTSGIYMYQAVTVSGKVARGNFAKN